MVAKRRKRGCVDGVEPGGNLAWMTRVQGGAVAERHGSARLPCSGHLLPLMMAAGALLAVAWLATAACGPGKAGTVELRIEWRAGEGFPGRATIHEALPGQPPGETLTYEAGEEPRLGPEITSGVLRPEIGALGKFVVAVRNPTDELLRFWVTPHLALPYTAERGLLIHCLCTGQQYEIPPHGAWTRVIEMGLNPEAGTRGPVVVTHIFVAGNLPAAE